MFAQSSQLPRPVPINYQQGLPQAFVTSIVQDQQGFIWVATRDGLSRFDGHQFKTFQPSTDGRPSLSYTSITKLQVDDQGQIWIFTEQGGIDMLNPETELFTNFSQLPFFQRAFGKRSILGFYPDHHNRLWVSFANDGLACIDLKTRRFRWFPPNNHPTTLTLAGRSILEDRFQTVWITTNTGLAYFDENTQRFVAKSPDNLPEKDRIHTLDQRPTGELILGSDNFFSVWDARNGTLRPHALPAKSEGKNYWGFQIARDSRGVIYAAYRNYLFRYTEERGPQIIAHFPQFSKRCLSLFIDQSDVLWMGTDGSGILKYDLRAHQFQTASYETAFFQDLLHSWLAASPRLSADELAVDPYFFRYTIDQQGVIWMNTGLATCYQLDLATRQLRKLPLPARWPNSPKPTKPMVTDEQNRVLVLDAGQLWRYEPDQKEWVRLPHQFDPALTGEVVQMVIDPRAFWLATAQNGLFRLDRRTNQLRQFTHQPTVATSLSSNILISLSDDPERPDRLWIGTFGSGLSIFDKRTGRSRRLTTANGLPNNVIYSVIPDQNRYLWMGTNQGLCRLNRRTFQTKTYTHEDGLLADEFNRFHYLKLPNDSIILAGLEGFTAFHPARLADDHFQPRVELTQLMIHNKTIASGDESPLTQPIQGVDRIELPHNQNFLTIRFAALQFNNPPKNRYRYQLQGLDDNWIETDQPQTVYTSLPPGRYTLLLNASNTSRIWSSQVRRLSVIIHPPWWATWWAYGLYVLIVVGLVWAFVRSYINRLRLRQTMQLHLQKIAFQNKETQQLRSLDELKTRFFTNITHEFRTPLTLIMAPVESLLTDLQDTTYAKRLGLISRNAKQLLGLINQLLELTKLDAHLMLVEETIGWPGSFVKSLVQPFEELAQAKNIQLTYTSEVTSPYWFDREKLERIISNLVSNAIKFTTSDATDGTMGKVAVRLAEKNGLLLTVTDTGIGIPPKQLPHIFDRFYQVDDSRTRQQQGTGIGLALVKELVDLQGGRITVNRLDNTELPWQTRFQVWLPCRPAGASNVAPNDSIRFSQFEPTIVRVPWLSEPSVMASAGQETEPQEGPLLLVVEDNDELAEFIADNLPRSHRVVRAANGAEGVKLALDQIPDLVISDVLMPVMDGYTLCQHLKQDERTSHIPVILLTAKATLESRFEGLSRGADDYLIKPFHVQELQLRVHNLLERQRRMRAWIKASLVSHLDLPEVVESLPTDPFLEKLYGIIEKHLENSNFGVEELATEIAISRTTLNRKLKALTGLSTRDLIRNYRLRQARELLRQGYNSSETAYRVGFESPAYFTKSFREFYGMTPLEYVRQS
ncbi:ATP-binding protein [Larkinella insperata]|uniref:histidine kinase n=1 Tax=Larkinella insperata TaxID=332158 RepID=A0ABW3QNI1_9BACT|nr:ATP-binding protein [Larkinella insperata]